MKRSAIAAVFFASILGCRKTPPANVAASPAPLSSPAAPASAPVQAAGSSSELHPTVHGIPFQLSLKNGVFAFCDDSGAQKIDVATGSQSAGAQSCDRKKEQIQSSCDDNAITSAPDGPADTIDLGKYTYHLSGHVRDCDQEGDVTIVSTGGDVEVIDSAGNKVAVIDTPAPDKVVIGSGWVAWNALGKPPVLKLETVAKAMEHAKTPKP